MQVYGNLERAALELLASDPSTSGDKFTGRLWFNTGTSLFKYWNAAAVKTILTSGDVVNADINASAAIAYSKLNLSASIVNADVASAAAIAVNKLAALTASRALVSDGSGFLSVSSVTAATLAFLDATSSVQTQLDAKQLRGTLTTKGDLYVATASNTVARQGVGSDGQVLTADAAQTNGIKWASVPNSFFTVTSSKVADYTAVDGDYVLADSSGGTFTITLPTATANIKVCIEKTDSSFTSIAIAGTIEGVSGNSINTQGEALELFATGTEWKILNRRIPSVWKSFIPTGAWSTNTTWTGFWRRVGDSIELQGQATLGGAPDSTTFIMAFPSGLSIDSAKLIAASSSGTSSVVAQGMASDNGTNYKLYGGLNSSNIQMQFQNNASGAIANVTQVAPFTFGSGDKVWLKTSLIPITGWHG